jgi:hypothetical protein
MFWQARRGAGDGLDVADDVVDCGTSDGKSRGGGIVGRPEAGE